MEERQAAVRDLVEVVVTLTRERGELAKALSARDEKNADCLRQLAGEREKAAVMRERLDTEQARTEAEAARHQEQTEQQARTNYPGTRKRRYSRHHW